MVRKQWAGITAVVVLLICIVPQVLAQQGNPCLRLIRGDNPDSVRVDTCAENNGATGPVLFYTKRWFSVVFVSDKYIIPLPYHPDDTIIEVTWQSIGTSFHGLRARFDTLEQHFGAFYLRKDYPNDTTAILGNRYSLRFMNEVNVDTVERFLDQDTMIYCYWRPGGIFLTSVPNDIALQSFFYITPDVITTGFIKIRYGTGLIYKDYVVTNMSGQIINRGILPASDNYTISISHFPSGKYYVQIANKTISFIITK